MKLLAALRKRHALKRYARELPPRLSHDYGGHEFFTRAQIEVAVGKLKLDPAFIAYGYAMFLPEETFNESLAQMPPSSSYEQARSEIRRYAPPTVRCDDHFYESECGGMGLGDGGP